MPKRESNQQKAANRKYARRAGLDVEVAGQLGQSNGRYNAAAVTEHDKQQQQKRQEKSEQNNE